MLEICKYKERVFYKSEGVRDIFNGGVTWRSPVIDWKLAFEDNPDGKRYDCNLTGRCVVQDDHQHPRCADCGTYKMWEEALKYGKWEEWSSSLS